MQLNILSENFEPSLIVLRTQTLNPNFLGIHSPEPVPFSKGSVHRYRQKYDFSQQSVFYKSPRIDGFNRLKIKIEHLSTYLLAQVAEKMSHS